MKALKTKKHFVFASYFILGLNVLFDLLFDFNNGSVLIGNDAVDQVSYEHKICCWVDVKGKMLNCEERGELKKL